MAIRPRPPEARRCGAGHPAAAGHVDRASGRPSCSPTFAGRVVLKPVTLTAGAEAAVTGTDPTPGFTRRAHGDTMSALQVAVPIP